MPIPFDDCPEIPCDYIDYLYPTSAKDRSPRHINFWFYLFWYFGIFNALALFLIAKVFSIYALNVN